MKADKTSASLPQRLIQSAIFVLVGIGFAYAFGMLAFRATEPPTPWVMRFRYGLLAAAGLMILGFGIARLFYGDSLTQRLWQVTRARDAASFA